MPSFENLANSLFGGKRAETNSVLHDGETHTLIGTATGDSADGSVMVELSSDVTNPDELTIGDETYFADADTSVELPTTEAVKEGDEVLVSIYGGTPLRSPVVTGVVGSGDRVAADAEAAREIAEATGQHFWDDDNGAHVTELARPDWEQQQTGPNSIWNSLGMLFRDGLNNLLALVTGQNPGVAIYDGQGNSASNIVASFTRDGAQIGSLTDRHLIIDSTGVQGVNQEGATVFDIDMTGSAAMRARSTAIRFMPYLQATIVAQGATPPQAQDAYLFSTDTASLSELDAGTTVDIVSTFYVKPDATENKFTGTPTVSGCTATVSGTGMALDGTVSITQITVGTPSSHTATVRVALASGGYYGARMVIDFDGTDFTASMYQSATTSRKYSSYLRAVGTYITLIPAPAFTLGTRADGDVSGALSCAIGEGLYAESDHQTVLGKFNVADQAGAYAVIVGNGDDTETRSNILTVSWDGNITAGLFNGYDIKNMGNNVVTLMRRAIPVQLFKGTYAETYNKTVTLSENVLLFSRICIEWRTSDGANGSTFIDIDVDNTVADAASGLQGWVASAVAINNNARATSAYIKSKLFFVSGNTIRCWSRSIGGNNVYQRSEATVKNNAATTVTNNELIGITKVLGWR